MAQRGDERSHILFRNTRRWRQSPGRGSTRPSQRIRARSGHRRPGSKWSPGFSFALMRNPAFRAAAGPWFLWLTTNMSVGTVRKSMRPRSTEASAEPSSTTMISQLIPCDLQHASHTIVQEISPVETGNDNGDHRGRSLVFSTRKCRQLANVPLMVLNRLRKSDSTRHTTKPDQTKTISRVLHAACLSVTKPDLHALKVRGLACT